MPKRQARAEEQARQAATEQKRNRTGGGGTINLTVNIGTNEGDPNNIILPGTGGATGGGAPTGTGDIGDQPGTSQGSGKRM